MSPSVVGKAEANNHGDPSASLGCLRKRLIDLISAVSILADECFGSANSNLSALFAFVKHAIVANVRME